MKKTILLTFFLAMACLIQAQTTSIQVKAFLQGAYLGSDSMSSLINSAGHLPLSQPYTIAPWNYPGTEQLSGIPADMVDWILLELRDQQNNSLGYRAALLLNDGSIVDTNLSSDIVFDGVADGNYYLLVDHRNHLPVMSAQAISTPSATAYDFSDTLNYPAVGGQLAQKELESGVFSLIAGDVNKDGIIKYSGAGNDRSLIIQRIIGQTGSTSLTATTDGYFPEDLSMDGQVKYAGAGNDASKIILSLIGMTGSTSITTTYSTPPLVPPAPTPTFTCGDSLLDARDGQKYATVQIGTQCWMAENLNVGVMVNGNANQSNNSTLEKYCHYNVPNNCSEYGGLYQWDEAMGYTTTEGTQGICPTGWHLPTDAEWCTLTTYLDPTVNCNALGWSGTDAGGKMKETGTTHWYSPNTGATNSSGFTALGAGGCNGDGNFYGLRANTNFWSSSKYSSTYGFTRTLDCSAAPVNRYPHHRTGGSSVRCLRDSVPCAPQPDQANAGPDSLGIAGDSVQLWANTSQVASGQWLVANGSGGVFSDSSAADSWFYGAAGDTFELVWTISNQCGSSSDTVLISFAPAVASFTCGDSLLDSRDGQKYATVQIGTQCWMAENLNVGTMVNGNSNQTNNSTIEKYCYNNDVNNCNTYGGLYQWDEAMGYTTTAGTQGICPTGWHLPTDAEWCTLTTFLDPSVNCNTWGLSGTDAGGKMKETGTRHWFPINTGATNSSGFTALGAGSHIANGNFSDLRGGAYFWSSSEYSSTNGVIRYLYCSSASVGRFLNWKTHGFSVRCLRN